MGATLRGQRIGATHGDHTWGPRMGGHTRGPQLVTIFGGTHRPLPLTVTRKRGVLKILPIGCNALAFAPTGHRKINSPNIAQEGPEGSQQKHNRIPTGPSLTPGKTRESLEDTPTSLLDC